MKKIFLVMAALLIITIGLITNFVSCAEIENTTIEPVEATIVDVHHRGSYTTTTMAGKVPVMISHPATWKVTLRYEDLEVAIDNKDLYNACVGNTGCTITVNLVTDTYTDGEVKRTLKLIEMEGE